MSNLKQLIAPFFILSFLLLQYTPCESGVIKACHKVKNGQLRLVSDFSECLPSEAPISWQTVVPQLQEFLVLYVDSEGTDAPGHGLSIDDPFETIGYALSSVPSLRISSEVKTLINVAQGTYNEAIIIENDNIWLRGSESDPQLTVVDGLEQLNADDENYVFKVKGPVGIRISGFKITGGKLGIFSSSATVECNYNIIEGNTGGYAGIVIHNSYLDIYNSNITGNASGVAISRTSYCHIRNSEIHGNTGNGLEVWYSSFGRLKNNLIFGNGGNGIQVGAGSSARLSGNEIHHNTFSGVDVTQMATASLRGGNKIYNNADNDNDWMGGIGVFHGSSLSIILYDGIVQDEIYENSGPGISISNNSSLFFSNGIVRANEIDGIWLNMGSSAQFDGNVTIENNAGIGLHCADADNMSRYGGVDPILIMDTIDCERF